MCNPRSGRNYTYYLQVPLHVYLRVITVELKCHLLLQKRKDTWLLFHLSILNNDILLCYEVKRGIDSVFLVDIYKNLMKQIYIYIVYIPNIKAQAAYHNVCREMEISQPYLTSRKV